jgi:hypothetical protein
MEAELIMLASLAVVLLNGAPDMAPPLAASPAPCVVLDITGFCSQ